MSELMKAVAAAWNPETACKKRKEDFIYIGDSVMVVRGRKIPQGTCGKVLRMFENPYDPLTYDMSKGALVLQTAGLDVQAIQYTNAKVQLELDVLIPFFRSLFQIKVNCSILLRHKQEVLIPFFRSLFQMHSQNEKN